MRYNIYNRASGAFVCVVDALSALGVTGRTYWVLRQVGGSVTASALRVQS